MLGLLRALRAPLAVLCALLLVASIVPHAMAGTAVCTGWDVGGPIDGSIDGPDTDGGGGLDCAFCSAFALALPAPEASGFLAPPVVALVPPPRATLHAVRGRAPPLGPRAPPTA